MKKIAFVADFDGKLTEKDIYNVLIDKYIGEEGLQAEILKIHFDINGIRPIEEVRAQGGDFSS